MERYPTLFDWAEDLPSYYIYQNLLKMFNLIQSLPPTVGCVYILISSTMEGYKFLAIVTRISWCNCITFFLILSILDLLSLMTHIVLFQNWQMLPEHLTGFNTFRHISWKMSSSQFGIKLPLLCFWNLLFIIAWIDYHSDFEKIS